jgi:uncharacterized membrane protein YeiB
MAIRAKSAVECVWTFMCLIILGVLGVMLPWWMLLLLTWASANLLCFVKLNKTTKHVMYGATTVSLVMSTFGNHGPAAEGSVQNLACVACSTGVVHRGL